MSRLNSFYFIQIYKTTLSLLLKFIINFFYRENYNSNKILFSNTKYFLNNNILNNIIVLFFKFKYNYYINNSRNKLRFKQITNNNKFKFNINYINYGLSSIWSLVKYWIFAGVLFIFIFIFLAYIRLFPFNKLLIETLLLSFFIYWLISGFVFFIKKYQYSKYTSVIQRFWKRTYIIFWLLEGNIFLIFMYLTLNASNEPFYMYDQIKFYKTFLSSWKVSFIKFIPTVILILLGYYLLISLKWLNYSKQTLIALTITLLLLSILWIEFYQFFHLLQYYGNVNILYDFDQNIWTWELDSRRIRLYTNYMALCLFAKFWHLVFIFVFWVFFILRVKEIKRIRYPLLAANLQNFLIIYIMTFIYMLPWLKFIFRQLMDINLDWYMLNSRRIGLRYFFNDLILYFNYILKFDINLYIFTNWNFYYWHNTSSVIGFDSYRKHIIRDIIITYLN